MSLTQQAALWFLPFVLPICIYVAYTDMREMRITNQAVVVLALVFVVVGLFVLPFQTYLWQLSHLAIVLVAGIILNAAGALGAGDAKFCAAAAPFVALGDLRLLIALFAAVLLAAYVTHRFAKFAGLRRFAPHWESWEQGKKFPMGLALGPALLLYIALGVAFGSIAP